MAERQRSRTRIIREIVEEEREPIGDDEPRGQPAWVFEGRPVARVAPMPRPPPSPAAHLPRGPRMQRRDLTPDPLGNDSLVNSNRSWGTPEPDATPPRTPDFWRQDRSPGRPAVQPLTPGQGDDSMINPNRFWGTPDPDATPPRTPDNWRQGPSPGPQGLARLPASRIPRPRGLGPNVPPRQDDEQLRDIIGEVTRVREELRNVRDRVLGVAHDADRAGGSADRLPMDIKPKSRRFLSCPNLLRWMMPGHLYLGTSNAVFGSAPVDQDDKIARDLSLDYKLAVCKEDIREADRAALRCFGDDFRSSFNWHSALAFVTLGLKYLWESVFGVRNPPKIDKRDFEKWQEYSCPLPNVDDFISSGTDLRRTVSNCENASPGAARALTPQRSPALPYQTATPQRFTRGSRRQPLATSTPEEIQQRMNEMSDRMSQLEESVLSPSQRGTPNTAVNDPVRARLIQSQDRIRTGIQRLQDVIDRSAGRSQ